MRTREWGLAIFVVVTSRAEPALGQGIAPVTQRRQELGIRAALGATPKALLRLVLWNGMVAALVGVALGCTLALALSGRIGALLFRTSARDPLVYAVTGLVVLAIALIASAVPGRRATRVDPLEAIRAE